MNAICVLPQREIDAGESNRRPRLWEIIHAVTPVATQLI
jgi:hypothetical protein